MKTPLIIKIFFLISFIVFSFFWFVETEADSGDNVSGWAWSDSIGWISFNCDNPEFSDCTNDYGVNVNELTGEFSDYAWSDNIGWISFNRADTGTPPALPYNGSETFIACLDFPGSGQSCDGVGDYKLSGWAKVLNPGNGWDGWISLRGIAQDLTPYGVYLNNTTNEFEEWAWSDDFGWISFNDSNYEVRMRPNNPPELQWLGTGNYTSDGLDPENGNSSTNFNYKIKYIDIDGDAPNFARVRIKDNGIEIGASPFTMTCDSGDYTAGVDCYVTVSGLSASLDYTYYFEAQDSKGADVVFPIPPTEIDAPDVNNSPNKPQNLYETMNSCSWGIPQVALYTSIILNWTYFDPEGDPQTAYEVWVDHTSPSIDPKFNIIVDPGASDSYTLNLSADQEGDWLSQLVWGTTYYWQVRVKDSQYWSEWSDPDSFTMKTHANPYPDFIPFPSSPVVDEVVEFIQDNPGVAQALCYNGGEHACEGDINAAYEWDFDYNSGVDSIFKGNASTTYDSIGNYTIRLRITDIALNSCYIDKTVNIGVPLPKWKEVSPF